MNLPLVLLILLAMVVVLVCVFVIVLIAISPYSMTCISPGDTYFNSGGVKHTLDPDVHYTRDVYAIKPATLDDMHKLLKFAVDSLDDAGVQWWAWGDTLLGAVENQGQVPWSTAMNLAVTHDQVQALTDIVQSQHDTSNYLWRLTADGYEVCANNLCKFPYVTISIYNRQNYDLLPCTPLDEIGQCTYHDAHKHTDRIVTAGDVLPLNPECTIPFDGDILLKLPHNPEQCLRTLYGATPRVTRAKRRKPVPMPTIDETGEDSDSSFEEREEKEEQKDKQDKQTANDDESTVIDTVIVPASVHINNAKTHRICKGFVGVL